MLRRSLWLLGLSLSAAVGCAPAGSATMPTPGSAAAIGGETLPPDADDALPPSKPVPGVSQVAFAASAPLDDEDLKEKSVDELLGLAESTFNPDERVKILDVLLEKEPKHRAALDMACITTQQKAQEMGITGGDRKGSNPYFMKSAEYARKIRDAYPELNPQELRYVPMTLYNAACTMAIQDKADEAMEYLTEALDAGFDDPVMETDPEIDSLRKRPDFLALKDREVKKKAKDAEGDMAKAVAEVKKGLAEFESFPFAFELKDLDDKAVSLADYKGKVMIVDIWGTWCPPCRAEIPQFVKLYNKYKDQGLDIVGINFERVPEDQVKSTIRDYLKENNVPYTCVIGDESVLEQVPDFQGFPTTLFIDREGKVRYREVGYSDEMAPKLEAIVKALVEEKGEPETE